MEQGTIDVMRAQRPGVSLCSGVYCRECGAPMRSDQIACNECDTPSLRFARAA